MAPIDISPGWIVPGGPDSALGLIFTYGGSSGSDQTTLRLEVNHRLILTMCQHYPANKGLAAELAPARQGGRLKPQAVVSV